MTPQKISDKLLSWASDFEPNTIEQALKTSRLPFVEGHVALMPDAHVGIGATVGSVIPTKGAIIPAAIGVDIGCGMIAVETSLNAIDLPDNLDALLPDFESAIPAGVGKGHEQVSRAAEAWFSTNKDLFSTELSDKQIKTVLSQFGTLGSGNHFFEICLDERDTVWIVLHSGSRGIGNQLAKKHIDNAKAEMKRLFVKLEDPDLAYYVEGTAEFEAYIKDMLACQAYAMANRSKMMDNALKVFFFAVGRGRELNRINCHHNFTQLEHHHGKNLWITRKGAIKADSGDFGVIPGSMGTRSFIVSGRGSAASYHSCSHGAGRKHSRSEAKRIFTVEDLKQQMDGKSWQHEKAAALLDEIPSCYKDIDQVMSDQKDLVNVEHVLYQVLNYKGA